MTTLVVFAREPVLGAVKTRLASTIGNAAARALYLGFVEDVCALTSLASRRVLAVAGDPDHPDLVRVSTGMERVRQPDGDLGARMAWAVETYAPVCLIGSDSPTLPRAALEDALTATQEVVIGPSSDGGYYLIGMRRLHREAFVDMAWSTPSVFAETLRRLSSVPTKILLPHYDVDDARDLELLKEELSRAPKEIAPATRRALLTV